LSLDSERFISYVSRISLAESERVALELDRAQSILEECPENLRGWEWYHLRRLTRPYQHRLVIDSYTSSGSFEWIDSNRLICETGMKPSKLGEPYSPEHSPALRIVDLSQQKPIETVGMLRAPFVIDPTRTWLVGVDPASDSLGGTKILGVRNLKTGETHRGFDQHTYNIDSLAISPDGKRVASLVSSGTTRFGGKAFTKKADDNLAIWETATGKLIARVPNVSSPMTFSPDGRFLYAMALRSGRLVGQDRLVKIDALTGARVNDLSPWMAEINGSRVITIRPDGKFLAAIMSDQVCIWNLETGKRVYRGTESASAIAFHPNKDQIAFLNPQRKQIQFLDLATFRSVAIYAGAEVRKDFSSVGEIRFSPDGKRFAVTGPEPDLRVWATNETPGLHLFKFDSSSSNGITRVVFDEKSTKLAFTGAYLKESLFPKEARSNKGERRGDAIVQLERFEITHAIPTFLYGSEDLQFIPGESDLLVVGETTIAPARVLPGGLVNQAVQTYGLIRYSPERGKPVWSIESPKGSSLKSVSISPDSKRFVIGWEEGFLIGSVETGETLLKGTGPARYVCWSPSGDYFAGCSGSLATEIVLYSTSDGSELRRLKEARPGGSGSSDASSGKLVISPDGRKVAFADGNRSRDDDGSNERQISIWDATTGEKVKTFAGHPGGVNAITFTPDGSRLVSGGVDLMVRIWDVKSGRQVYQLRGARSEIRGVAVSPDGRFIAATDGWSCRVWDGSK
jgi:WD40 repeat protein